MKFSVAGLLCFVAACAQATGPAGSDTDGAVGAADASVGMVDGGGGPGTPDGGGNIDAELPPDAEPLPDAAPVGPVGDHLLLTEVVLQPTAGELVEIFNPTDAAIALDDYYLADVGSYYLLPAGQQSVGTSDFVVRFPAGASLGARKVAVISIAPAADFTTSYGSGPDYSVGASSGSAVQMLAVDVGSSPTLTNAGESVVLFHWDGQSDLVQDVDLIEAGKPTGSNLLVDKSGVQVDGPDADTTPTAYGTDAFTLTVQSHSPGSGVSTKRLLPESGHETMGGGGNGLTGDDETSEDVSATWDSSFSVPTPGSVPAALGPQ